MAIEIPSDNYTEFGDLHATLFRIKDAVVARYTNAGIDLPPRHFAAMGDVSSSVANDCEQLVVNFVQAYLGLPGQPDIQPRGCPLMMSADFIVQVTRCVPGPKVTNRGSTPPTPEAIEASTLQQAIDAQLLLQTAYEISSAQGVSATVTVSGSDGKMQSVMLNVSVSLFEAF